MIADDLTRTDPYRPSANGPYRHLLGQDKGRISQTALARLIDVHVPEHIDTPQLLRAIAALGHAAKAIGEDDEYDRIRQMLSDADPDSVATLLD